MKKVYISGPMSNMPAFNFPAFFKAAEVVRAAGHEPINPAKGVTDLGRPWDWYMRRAITLLMDADEIWALPGWSTSRGAKLEVHNARQLGMPLSEFDHEFNVRKVLGET